MKTSNFNIGTTFAYGSANYIVVNRTNFPSDHRMKCIWVAIVGNDEPVGFYMLDELKQWALKGIVNNIIEA